MKRSQVQSLWLHKTPSLPPQTEHLEMKIYTRIGIFIYGAKQSSTQRATKQTEHWTHTENATPHPTANSWDCCQNCFMCSAVFAEGEGGNDVARAAQTAAFGSPVPPENPCNREWRAGMKGKPIKHCVHRGLRLVPKSVKAGPAMCALCMREDFSQQSPSSSFLSAKGHKPLLKEIF